MASCHCFWNHHKLAIRSCLAFIQFIHVFLRLSFLQSRLSKQQQDTDLANKNIPIRDVCRCCVRKTVSRYTNLRFLLQTVYINFLKDISSTLGRIQRMPICPRAYILFISISLWLLFSTVALHWHEKQFFSLF